MSLNVIDIYNEEIIGYIEATTELSKCPIIVKELVYNKIPDAKGNEVIVSSLRHYRPYLGHNSTQQCIIKGMPYNIFKDKMDVIDKRFFSYHPVKFKYKFLMIDFDKYGAYHPKYSFRPVFNFPFDTLYEGISLNDAISYLESIDTETFERSFYRRAGADDSFEIFQKINFDTPPSKLFFLHLSGLFNFKWYDLNQDYYEIAKTCGEGFYRQVDDYYAYASMPTWEKYHTNHGLSDIIKWFKDML